MIENTIKKIIRMHEGGYVDHPADKGGPTKYGITQATLSNFLGRHAEAEDVQALDLNTAVQIIEPHYYHYPRIDQLPEMTQALMLDMSINHGPRRAIKILQAELQQGGYNVGNIDGIIGKKTLKTTEQALKAHGIEFTDQLIERRLLFYRGIIERNPSQKVFWSGWMSRAESFRPISGSFYQG